MTQDSFRQLVSQTKRQVLLTVTPTLAQNQAQATMGGSVAADGTFTPASMWGTDPFPFTFSQDSI